MYVINKSVFGDWIYLIQQSICQIEISVKLIDCFVFCFIAYINWLQDYLWLLYWSNRLMIQINLCIDKLVDCKIDWFADHTNKCTYWYGCFMEYRLQDWLFCWSYRLISRSANWYIYWLIDYKLIYWRINFIDWWFDQLVVQLIKIDDDLLITGLIHWSIDYRF